MVTERRLERRWSRFLTVLLCCSGASVVTAACGFSGTTAGTGTGGTTGSAGSGNPGAGTSTTGTAGSGSPGTGGSGTPQGGNSTTGGVNGTAGSVVSTGGSSMPIPGSAPNYEYTGTWPKAPMAIAQKPGKLTFTKVLIHSQFLAESCSIADYNNDGVPDVSSGRIWYQGPDFKTQHPFRDGHGVLPSQGDGPEIDTGVSDDWADYPFDVNHDGNTDIINIAQCDVNEVVKTANKVGTVQPHATAYWYENPGPAGQTGNPNWTSHLMNQDVRLEQHGFIDMNGDGLPEIYGACKNCMPPTTKGYYQGDPAAPNSPWTFHSVTGPFTFPFEGGLGWMHGEGGGDVNGDGLPDLLERSGAWLQQPGGTWNQTPCTAKNVPAGCGYVPQNFYDGLKDDAGNKGASHMYATDMDMDGIPDVVAADWAHGEGLYWYKQSADGKFTKYQFLGGAGADDIKKWSAGFSEPHALQVVDMDGDGRPDIVTGKMRFAHPHGYGDPDGDGRPYIYVFKNVAAKDPIGGGPITLQPILVDPVSATPGAIGTPDGGMGVGRQLAVGHVNTDGIMDICVGTKVGLAVFLGQAP
jgi:FG-GAP-like repeat